jgi:2-polyprenyl-3-methyl-5-hydroxy-6-metoxy-1,4-benzoquinol methylase
VNDRPKRNILSSDLEYGKEYFAEYFKKSKFSGKPEGAQIRARFWLKRYLRSILRDGGRILEVGCGPGFLVKYLGTEKGFKITGLDISQYALSIARSLQEDTGFVAGRAESLPFKSRMFQCVIALDVVEHLQYPEYFIDSALDVLADGGIFVMRTPNLESYGARRKEKGSFMWRDRTHINLIKMNKWRTLLEMRGFTVIKEGTDFLWDVPYWRVVPYYLQKLFFVSITNIITFIWGFTPWRQGENYYCILQKKSESTG